MNAIAFYRSKMVRRVRQAERNGHELTDLGVRFHGWVYDWKTPEPYESDAVTRGAYVKTPSQ